ncbi:MiaB-like tRNA modifying enzyme [Treponema maltophilum ATCC 51939]|uniref:MiaB-like tRNA modifying enzyme n=1 Tax=Treponema maltophilum ATCC 51939 TaxID=1125699 RepID=S3K4H7_TREMA|nr:tRNA (N(6)-L-threonylcarbamoyladenosine(37)-C(2))-methylthiotransferase MtaB [Treponema maltophilum]EPF32445.1 MiaB-like tRNA modifying enzyme [Treponema maltophilum ATCC 51939]
MRDPAQKSVVRFETLGCKLNQIESEGAARAFADRGFDCRMAGVAASSPVDTDTVLCIVNTCTVTAKAEQKCRRMIRLLLEKYPASAILVTGCYAQLDGSLLLAMDDRIAVLGGKSKDALVKLPAFLTSFIDRRTDSQSPAGIQAENTAQNVSFPLALADGLRRLYAQSFEDARESDEAGKTQRLKPVFAKSAPAPVQTAGAAFALSTDTFLQHSRPSLKIQDGCDSRCSYCRICLARGSSVSLDPETVLSRVLQLEKMGHREVVLTGVNLGQYGFSGITGLLGFLLDNTKAISLRLSSLHPQIVDEKLCAVLAHERVRPHFHLSVQSGSDAVLSAMKRPYRSQSVYTAVENLRRIKKKPFIACDIIAGFPGETQADFNETLELCRTCEFSWIHAFPFSPRPGTEAFSMKNAVPASEVKNRIRELSNLALAQKKAYIESCVGKDFKAVVEKYRIGQLRAVTENFLHVQIQNGAREPAPASKYENLGGQEVFLRIDAVHESGLHGEECEAFASFI